jgi:glyoxylase-like metal-dependent hydrolase (beta-lactamase superfamily II)
VRLFTAAAPPFMKNAYLVAGAGSDHAVLVDPGDEVESILAIAVREGLSVQAILLTHAHIDHISGVDRARTVLGVETWLHADDEPLYNAVVQQGQMFGIRVAPQPPVDRFYAHGESLAAGDLEIRVHHTPGHSPGGVCLEVRDGGGNPELIVGDTLFAGSIGRTDLPGGNHGVLVRSIRDVLFAFDDRTPVHPGHGPSTTIGAERRTNPFLT